MKIKKKEKSVLDIIVANVITLIFILTFLLMVFFVYCSMTNRMPTVFGYHMLRVVTGSMDPTYPEGSYIVVKSTDTDKLKVGEVISFYSRDEAIAGQVNTHRIKEIKNNNGTKLFVTKGDANPTQDPVEVQPEDIVGKVIAHANVIDGIGKAIRNPWVYLIIVIIPLSVRFIIELKNVAVAYLEYKKEKDNQQEIVKLAQEQLEKEKLKQGEAELNKEKDEETGSSAENTD
ncbi:signal peptidase I [uncultured Eubacterium sp.]|uniref:signal peptidase I n=1 Tax=uncultured Eubacterium sp. TaxID=165185 RepID=UPI002595F7D3|nr:signal peptidase I [uncultured Eubacterium sp.]